MSTAAVSVQIQTHRAKAHIPCQIIVTTGNTKHATRDCRAARESKKQHNTRESEKQRYCEKQHVREKNNAKLSVTPDFKRLRETAEKGHRWGGRTTPKKVKCTVVCEHASSMHLFSDLTILLETIVAFENIINNVLMTCFFLYRIQAPRMSQKHTFM